MGDIYSVVRHHAVTTPDKIAILNENGDAISYRQLMQAVEQRYWQLSQVVTPGKSRVALSLHEGEQVPITVLALNQLGVGVIPLNPTLQTSQLQQLLKAVDADVVVAEADTVPLFRTLDGLQMVVVGAVEGEESSAEVDANAANREYQPNAPFLITLSSGSTGDPKPIIF